MNEEEVKIKIVLPLLERLGISKSELTFEKSFFLNVGRHVLHISPAQKQRGDVGARLDILVTRNRNNLLIIEIKESDHILSDADRDQAVSYARLIHPIAPYVMVTNGNDWKLFDSITKEPVDKNSLTFRSPYEITLSDDLRNEALELFLGLSLENLNAFCASQVRAQMKPLIGSPHDLTKKYIPEINVPRVHLLETLENFIRGDKEGFLLLGESGMGKTSALCHYAIKLLESQAPVMFFRGWSLEAGVLVAVAEEFNWSFLEEQSSINLFRRLNGVLKNHPLVIIIDAVDEWLFFQRAQNLLKALKSMRGRKIKFVLSCKAGSWDAFSKNRGTSTGIDEYLYHMKTPETPNVSNAIAGFNSAEFNEAVQKYREIFHFYGEIEPRVLDEAKKNPFLLRVIFEVAGKAGLQNMSFSPAQLFEEYYRQLLEKTGNAEIAEAQLNAVSKAIWEENNGWLDMCSLRKHLNLGLNETLLPCLFEHNILTRSPTNAERIGFYFQQLRDFIISFKVLSWQTLSDSDFKTSVQPIQMQCPAFQQEGVHADVLSFYFRQANEIHKQILAGELYENARKYLDRYVEILAKHFPLSREIFEPYTEGEIGFDGELLIEKKCLGGYGFRHVRPTEERILFVPVNEIFSRVDSSGMRAGGLHHSGSANGFIEFNIDQEVLENEIISQIEKLVQGKRLYEGRAPELLHGHIIANLYGGNPKTFLPLFDSSGQSLQFPIMISQVEELLLREKLKLEFEHDLLQQKRKAGEVEHLPAPSRGESFRCIISPSEMAALNERIDKALASRLLPDFKTNFGHVKWMEGLLQKAIKAQHNEIQKPRWVERYILMDALRARPQEASTIVNDYLVKIFEAFLENYQLLVESNFPTTKNVFSLLNAMPVYLLIGVSPGLPSAINSTWWSGEECQIQYAICKNPGVRANSVCVCSSREFPTGSGAVSFKGVEYNVFDRCHSDFTSLTSSLDAIDCGRRWGRDATLAVENGTWDLAEVGMKKADGFFHRPVLL